MKVSGSRPVNQPSRAIQSPVWWSRTSPLPRNTPSTHAAASGAGTAGEREPGETLQFVLIERSSPGATGSTSP